MNQIADFVGTVFADFVDGAAFVAEKLAFQVALVEHKHWVVVVFVEVASTAEFAVVVEVALVGHGVLHFDNQQKPTVLLPVDNYMKVRKSSFTKLLDSIIFNT